MALVIRKVMIRVIKKCESLMKLEQQTWSSPSPFLGTKEFDS